MGTTKGIFTGGVANPYRYCKWHVVGDSLEDQWFPIEEGFVSFVPLDPTHMLNRIRTHTSKKTFVSNYGKAINIQIYTETSK